jgi:hypothetical protein
MVLPTLRKASTPLSEPLMCRTVRNEASISTASFEELFRLLGGFTVSRAC